MEIIKWFPNNIRKFIKDDEFVNSMNELELRAWTSFVDAVKNILGSHQAENYKELVEKLLKSLQDLGVNMSVKVHFLHFQLIVMMWVMSKENDSIRISKQRKRTTRDGETNEWWLTTAEVSKVT